MIRSEESEREVEQHLMSAETQRRIQNLMMKAAEIQKLPQDFNERVTKLKERTAEITKRAACNSRSKDQSVSVPRNILIQED